jgi:ATP-dependent protease ClpP protease subunit
MIEELHDTRATPTSLVKQWMVAWVKGTPPELLEIITAVDGDRWFSAAEAVAYGLADEVIGGPAGTRSPAPPGSRAARRR